MATIAVAPGAAGSGQRWEHPVRLTALYRAHLTQGADLVERDGWMLPRSYGNPSAEETAVREAVGLIDIGESGKIDLKSDRLDAALALLRRGKSKTRGPDKALTLRVTALNKTIRVFRLTEQQALLLTAPAALQGTLDALAKAAAAQPCTHVTDLTGTLCGMRLLGPKAPLLLEQLSSLDLAPDRFADGVLAQGGLAAIHVLIARHDEASLTGYDIYVDRDLGAYLWDVLLEQGAPLGLRPVGRDVAIS